MSTLSQPERILYGRQMKLEKFGEENQIKLKTSRVLVVGAGGLGCPVLQYLVAAGVGNIGIIDHDVVSMHNLPRQILFKPEDVNTNKALTAAEHLTKMNSYVSIRPYAFKLTTENAKEILSQYDIVIDGTDNFKSRFLINDFCKELSKPVIYGAIQQLQGQISVFHRPDKNGISYELRDVYPDEPKEGIVSSCTEVGVLGSSAGVVGSLMANETIKLISNIGENAIGYFIVVDMDDNGISKFTINKLNNSNSEIPQNNHREIDGENKDLSPQQLKMWIKQNKKFILIDIREQYERNYFNIGGTHRPLSTFNTTNIDVPHNEIVVLYCQHGQRSYQLKHYLETQYHFNNIYHLADGIAEWINTYGMVSTD